jgi:hypothetical protein
VCHFQQTVEVESRGLNQAWRCRAMASSWPASVCADSLLRCTDSP